MELVHTEERFMKLMSKPTVESFQRFSEDLVAVNMLQPRLALKTPIYAGMVILELAKLLMYDFYYNVFKKKYGDRVDLLFTDTDSLCISVNTQDTRIWQKCKMNLIVQITQSITFCTTKRIRKCWGNSKMKCVAI